MNMDKVFFGVISYGPQIPEFWTKYSDMLALLPKYDISYLGQSNGRSMRADGNRNIVVNSFLKSNADWLMWVDTDNVIPLGGIRRLLDNHKEFVTALYYLKSDPHYPIAFIKNKKNNRYNEITGWRRGEIIPVDMAGMGACLTHRSVYEKIAEQCVVVQRYRHGVFPMLKSRVKGKLPDKANPVQPIVTNGLFKESVCIPDYDYGPFPYFSFEYGKSEDVNFYALAEDCKIEMWCDTSVECDHVGTWVVNGKQYRDTVKKNKTVIPLVKEYVVVEEDEYKTEGA